MTRTPPPLVTTHTRAIAAEVRKLRRARDWTADELAERVTATGYPCDRSVVSSVESGRRKSITPTEVMIFAWVLDVAPVDLLCPADADTFQITPAAAPISADEARRWIARGPQSRTKRGAATSRVVAGGSKVVENIYDRMSIEDRLAQLERRVDGRQEV
jgi:transcriptional regulator with XRE-family HTH domain